MLDEDTARKILAIERRTWLYAGVKESVVREQLEVGMVTYYQRLNALIDSELGLRIDPITCRRLQRVRAARRVA